MHSLVQPNTWAALRLPSGNLRVLQVIPNTTISLGKYGSFPSNLIIQRPYHLTFELQDKAPGENFNRIRVVPASELYSDTLNSGPTPAISEGATPAPDADDAANAANAAPKGIEYSLVDSESGAVVAKTDRAELDITARQTLTLDEIEALKKDGTDAGRDLIAKLMLSHTAIDQKTEYSLAKYKLLKTRKFLRQFSVLPLDFPLLNYFTLEEKDSSKILDLREEMTALLGCWANVHFGGEDRCEQEAAKQDTKRVDEDTNMNLDEIALPQTQTPGRWLVVDDTAGLLVAALAERMGILYPPEKKADTPQQSKPNLPEPQQGDLPGAQQNQNQDPKPSETPIKTEEGAKPASKGSPDAIRRRPQRKHIRDDLHIPFARANTMTLIHHNSQPNLTFLKYYDYEIGEQNDHPLARHLMSLTWLQLVEPDQDILYSMPLPTATPEELQTWKANRRGNFHRKRRRWAQLRHVVDTTRQGGFSGLVVASTMDPVSIMRHCVPLLAGGAPIAIYAQSIEGLSELADCYSLARRAAWATHMPEDLVGSSVEAQERWGGNDDFPLNPSLVLGASIQTSRVRHWQVLPGRTHPLMTSRGGAEGYVFTGWRVKPAEGKVEARGKARPKKRKADDQSVAP